MSRAPHEPYHQKGPAERLLDGTDEHPTLPIHEENRVLKAYLIAVLSGITYTGIAAMGIAGCHPDTGSGTESVPTTRIPAPATVTPRYTAPETTMPIMPTWTYGPGVEAVEVTR